MSAPCHVPATASAPSVYRSPPRRGGSWLAERPGEVVGAAAHSGIGLGCQGPDQGYALKIAERFADRLVLESGERADDVLAGCCAVALRRASLLGRAPVVHDVRLALELFGFLSEAAPGLVAVRRERFAGAASHHGYGLRLRLAASIPEPTLQSAPAAVAEARSADWRTALGL